MCYVPSHKYQPCTRYNDEWQLSGSTFQSTVATDIEGTQNDHRSSFCTFEVLVQSQAQVSFSPIKYSRKYLHNICLAVIPTSSKSGIICQYIMLNPNCLLFSSRWLLMLVDGIPAESIHGYRRILFESVRTYGIYYYSEHHIGFGVCS